MPRDKNGRFAKEQPEESFVPEDYTPEQATALNMERASRLVTNGVPPGTPTVAPRITTGPMPMGPFTGAAPATVTYHSPAIVAEPPELTAEDYAAVLDPELAEELRKVGVHPEQIVLPPLPAPAEIRTGEPPPPATAAARLPVAALLTFARDGNLKLTRLVGHAATSFWISPGSNVGSILAAFGITVIDLTQDEPKADR